MDVSSSSTEQDITEAAERVAGLLKAAQDLASPGAVKRVPNGKMKPGSTRHIEEVIAAERLCGKRWVSHAVVNETMRAAPKRVADEPLVLAIARAYYLIVGRPFGEAEEKTFTDAVRTVAVLRERAEQDVQDDAPRLRVFPRRAAGAAAVAGVVGITAIIWLTTDKEVRTLGCRDVLSEDVITEPARVGTDDQATMITPTLDFAVMNGSARYLSRQGHKYFWGRAGSDDHDPHSGGVRLLWKLEGNQSWHECRTPLPKDERGYVRTAAVPNEIGDRTVTIKVCLWRDEPKMEHCTAEL